MADAVDFCVKYKIADNKPSLKGKVANRRFDGRVSLLLGEKVMSRRRNR